MSERAQFTMVVCLTWTVLEAVAFLLSGVFDGRAVFMVWVIVLYCAWQMPDRGREGE